MKIEVLGPHDYDRLGTPSEQCPYFVVAFQDGFWANDICPPFRCDGYQFNRREFEEALGRLPDVLLKSKPRTRRHPKVDVYYISSETLAEQLRTQHRKPPVRMEPCPTDGTRTGLIGTDGDIVCEICGGPGDKWKAPRDVM